MVTHEYEVRIVLSKDGDIQKYVIINSDGAPLNYVVHHEDDSLDITFLSGSIVDHYIKWESVFFYTDGKCDRTVHRTAETSGNWKLIASMEKLIKFTTEILE